jgi:hypothetical protein
VDISHLVPMQEGKACPEARLLISRVIKPFNCCFSLGVHLSVTIDYLI